MLLVAVAFAPSASAAEVNQSRSCGGILTVRSVSSTSGGTSHIHFGNTGNKTYSWGTGGSHTANGPYTSATVNFTASTINSYSTSCY